MKSTRESLWAVAPSDRPREKLERLGPGGLTDAELVALVLGSGLPGINVLDNAASLLQQAGGVHELMVMTVRELTALMGVGVATAGRVVAVSELWRRAHDPLPGVQIEQPGDIVDIIRAFVAARSPAPPHDPAPHEGVVPVDGSASSDGVGAPGAPDPTPLGDSAPPAEQSYVVVADQEMRVLVVVPLARSEGESIPSLVPRVLHEVLYRGGAAFALAIIEPEPSPAEETEQRDIRDVLKLASSTVGLRYLSTVVMTPTSWSTVD